MKIYPHTHTNLSINQIGGKALNLYRLKKYGLSVPDFLVIDQEELEKVIPEELKQNFDSSEISAFIDEFSINNELLDQISKVIPDAQDKLFSVRSSAVQEDGQQFSFAGQFETYLYVSFEDIPKYVKEVWKSNFSERVFQYVKNNNLSPQFGIGVVIQEMIDPDVSGVGFGINPNTGEEDSKVLCSVYGVGEGLVSGQLNADTFTLNGKEYDSILVKKNKAAKRESSGAIALIDVPLEKQEVPSLKNEHIQEIKNILEQLENEIGSPQDIEFAIKDDKVYLLQTRPITAINKKEKGKNRIIWDNSNIIESYPGVTTPLTFSYILDAYKHVYVQLALIMGVSKKVVQKHEDTFSNMLGLINGRVYYNLLSWYRMLALFPGYKLNKRFMENMMGVKERFDLPKEEKSSKLAALGRTVLMILRIIGHLFTIKKQTKKFMKDVDSSIEKIKHMDLESMTAWELKQAWIEMNNFLIPKWKAPVLNDSFAMYYFGKLQKLIEKYAISDNKNIQNDLLCGSKDIISVEPVHRSIALATEISEDKVLKQLFDTQSPSEIWEALHEKKHADFMNKIHDYLEVFGERCVGELKLETISYKQDPTLFIATLKSFVIQNVTKKSTDSTIDQQLRNDAERAVKEGLKGKPFKKMKFNRILKKTRYFVSNRENLRYERTRAFGITRSIFVQIGKEFEKGNVLESYQDIFYLTLDEIFAFIEGTSVDTNLKALTEMRKIEYQAYEDMELPAERFTTFDAVNMGNDFFDRSIENSVEGDLSGLGCCPGVVKAKARVVKHPNEVESLNGDILITSSTDPGWVTLFPTASAIVVERGSLLSHSAIVSREMGIPCIVGVTGLLKRVKTGDILEIDGSNGTIKFIEDGE
ncbi:MAG: phosphoenolpyruvate synthase [Crocinitomicaceae bacterium]|nr:phosphoenolpyruvate synthase [Crocinitomicaceae bacterium]